MFNLNLNTLIVLPLCNLAILIICGNYEETPELDINTTPHVIPYHEGKAKMELYELINSYPHLISQSFKLYTKTL
jgi:hypothetical protein